MNGGTGIPPRAGRYGICFDFPEEDDPVFAGFAGNETMGFATTLKTARRFTSEKVAERVLLNSYGPAVRRYGVVVELGEVPA